MDFDSGDVTIRIVDVARECRKQYGDQAEWLIGRRLRDQELRLEITAQKSDRRLTITLGEGGMVTAEEIMKMVNENRAGSSL